LARLASDCAPSVLTRSPLERAFARFCARENLSMPLFNQIVAGFEVDCYWPEHGLIVELDGYGPHRSRRQFELDRRRDAALQLAGQRVLRVTGNRMKRDGAALAAQLRAATAPKRPAGDVRPGT
jgi:very-short-patch-repair endonuclease